MKPQTKQEIIQRMKNAQIRQNELATEILNYLETKEKELFSLSEIIDNGQKELYTKHQDDTTINFHSSDWNELYDLTEGVIFGYNIEHEQRLEVINQCD